MKRRQFIQFATSALATIGLNHLDLQRQSLRYGKILAQSTPRKLALLVGINQYPTNSDRFTSLSGCVNDVRLQEQLLINRFGFQPEDIKAVTDTEATRDGILTAFETHLIQQAKPGDVVVFHFSGHGSQVIDPNPIDPTYPLNSSFVPADEHWQADKGIVNEITGHTLFLLMFALKQKTDNVTVVLDSCHSGGGTRGNVKIRAIPGGMDFRMSPEEVEYQQQWLKRLNLSPEDFIKLYQQGVATGAVIASAQREQFAADYPFPGFYAGAFTYLLTQTLWQNNHDVESAIAGIERDMRFLSTQLPLVEVPPDSRHQREPIYFTEPKTLPAEGVVTTVENNRVQVWLGGISQESLEAISEGSIFTPPFRSRGETPKVELISRNGLIAEAKVEGNVQPGELLQEFARTIPTDWKLHIGLDPSLSQETETAKTELESLKRIQAILPQPGEFPYPVDVHYILSRMTDEYQQQLLSDTPDKMPPVDSLGLFSPALEVIPDSFGIPGETVTQGIERLQGKLKSLLAARIMRMTLNAESSRLNLEVTMGLENRPEIIAQAFTPRGCRQDDSKCPPLGSRSESGQLLSHQLSVGDAFQFKVTNREEKDLHLGIMLVDPTAGITVLFPNELQENARQDPDNATRIQPNQTLSIPNPNKDDFVLVTEEAGLGEVLIVASEQPLTKALLKLRSLARGKRGIISTRGEDSLEIINDLVDDVSRGAQVGVRRRIRTSQMAALSITFNVV